MPPGLRDVGLDLIARRIEIEMRLMLGEVRVGQSRQEALRRLSERADTPAIRSFTRAMAQSDAMGVPISQTLKALAIEARTRKKATAEDTYTPR